MAGLFNSGKKGLLDGSINWVTDTIHAMLVDDEYAFNPDHAVVDDLVASEVAGAGYSRQSLGTKAAAQNDTSDRGELDAADLQWAGIDAGTVGGVVLYKLVNDDTDSVLIAFIDSGGFPVPTNGTNLDVQWASSGLVHGIQG